MMGHEQGRGLGNPLMDQFQNYMKNQLDAQERAALQNALFAGVPVKQRPEENPVLLLLED